MGLDRGMLARIDRRLLAGLGRDETWHMVWLPTTRATWSTWWRYCEAAGVSMGRAIAALIGNELSNVVGETGDDSPLFAGRVDEGIARREVEVARRERTLEAGEDRLRAWDRQLRRREGDLDARERQAELAAAQSARSEQPRARSDATNRARAGQASSTSAAMAWLAAEHNADYGRCASVISLGCCGRPSPDSEVLSRFRIGITS